MQKLNQEFVSKINKILIEKNEDVILVGPEYYESFLKLEPAEMRYLLAVIIEEGAEYISSQVSSGKWDAYSDWFDYFTSLLELMARGNFGVRASDEKLVVLCPLGPPPDPEMEKRLDQKIKESMSLIKETAERVVMGWKRERARLKLL